MSERYEVSEELLQINVRIPRTHLRVAKAIATEKNMSLTRYVDDLLDRDAQANLPMLIESYDRQLKEIALARQALEQMSIERSVD